MQEKVVQVPFNREVFVSNQKAVWAYSVKSVWKVYTGYAIAAAVSFILGFANQDKAGYPFFLLSGGAILLYVLSKLKSLYRVKKNFFNNVSNLAIRYEREGMDCIYTLNDYGFAYEDKEKSFKFSWPLLDETTVFNDSLIIKLKDDERVFLTISKAETGDDTFEAIAAILYEKTSG